MRIQKSRAPQTELEIALEHFESWRRAKEHHRIPIPEALWQEAVELASTHSICEISRALRLDYNRLKERIQRNKELPERAASPPAAFVELSLSAATPLSECTIELERSDGMKMRMSLKAVANDQILDLAQAFWREA